MSSLELVPVCRSTAKKTKRKVNKSSEPHLPKELVKELLEQPAADGFESWVFHDFLRTFRIDVVNVNAGTPLDPDAPMNGDSSSTLKDNVFAAAGRSILHYAALRSDHLLVLEMIRLGGSVDKRDSKGQTPLSIALDHWNLALHSGRGPIPPFNQNPAAYYERMRYIVRSLLEQHADPNLVVDGMTALHRACTIGDWDLISILLNHGAQANPPQSRDRTMPLPVTFLRSRDQARFRRLVQTYSNKPRPERLCPCQSGTALAECHAKVNGCSYPSHFMCICGSGRSYASCSCSRRNEVLLQVKERYIKPLDRIVGYFCRDVSFDLLSTGPSDPVGMMMQEAMEELCVVMDLGGTNHPSSTGRRESGMEKVRKIAKDLEERGMVDPAYCYALHRVNWSPRPQGRSLDKRSLQALQALWNAAVDEYIASGQDSRARIDIEREAKIGVSHGPLHPKCQYCYKMQGRDVDELRTCSKCKIIVYCSRECQANDWPNHKVRCGTHRLREQMLDSQTAILADVQDGLAERCDGFMAAMSAEERDSESGNVLKRCLDCFRRGVPLTEDLRQISDRARELVGQYKNGEISLEVLRQRSIVSLST